MPFRAEVDIKLGGTQCHLLINRLKLWMDLYFNHKRKRNSSPMQSSSKPIKARSSHTDLKSIMWTCTVSAPETTIILYNLNDAPIYLVCSQSSHLFVNNITSEKISVHMELGELLLHVPDEDHGCLKESFFAVETSLESLLHISRVSVDWGLRETESIEDDKTEQRKLTLAVEVSGSSTCLSLQRLQLLVFTFMSYAAVLKSVSAINNRAKKRKGNSNSKLGANSINVIRLNLEKFTVKFVGDLNVENTDIADPKRVNFGSQGGEVIITEVEEGKPRVAYVKSSSSRDTRLELKCITSFNIVHFSLCRDKNANSTQLELERGKIMYQEVAGDKTFVDLTLLALQSGKVVYQIPNNNGITRCALVCATDVTIRWEPDVHLVLYETMLRMKSLLQEQKNLSHAYVTNTLIFNTDEDFLFEGIRKPTGGDFQGPARNDKQHNKELVLAIDIEQLTLSASLADGVECLVKVQSIFSEDAKIGMLLEDLGLSLNEATVFKSNRLQISRIPTSPEGSTGTISRFDAEIRSSVTWDCLIQGRDVRIIMPHRLQLRAIEDAVEDMYRGLKLVMAAKRQSLCPSGMKNSKHSKNRSSKFGCIKFSFREVIAEIEEEPIQGWLDEHYQLMKNEVCELSARLRFLDEIVAEGSSLSGIPELKELYTDEYVNLHENLEMNSSDQDIIKTLQARLQQQAFQSYYKACQKLVISGGSGACRKGLQAGFRPSVSRSSLLSIRASNLEVTLTEIEGGKLGMVEMIRKLDCVSPEMEVPFSRMMGRNISINTGSLVIQLRNYSFPMLAATMGKCNGSIILAQQATTFPPQYFQNVYIGRWHKVEMLRSMSGTTPPLKMYSELPIEFEKAEVAYGVGFEPAIADLSYAFTIALRKANLSIRNDGALPSGNVPGSVLFPSGSCVHTDNQTAKKERSLPWWDDMRYYIHGKNSIRCSDFKWNFLATTDPYEKIDKLQIVAAIMDIQQSEGRLAFYAKEFNICISSLEHLLKNYDLKLPVDVRGGFIYSAAFQLDITMNWECESGNPLNHYLHALPSELEPRKKVYDPFRSTSFSLRWNFSLKPSHSIEPVEESSSSMGDADRLSSKVKAQVMSAARRSNTNRNFYDSASVFPPGKLGMVSMGVPTVNLGAHDLIWIFRWWNLYYNPPHKIRSFSKWPRFGVPRSTRSGNLSLDKVMTEFMLRVDATPTCIKHVPLGSDDPANGLTFNMKKLKYELCYSRGRQRYTFESKRDPLDQVYQGLDLHVLKAELKDPSTSSVEECSQNSKRVKQPQGVTDSVCNEQRRENGITADISNGDGLLLYTDYFTIRKQSPKVDPSRLLSWQEEGRSIRSLEATYVRSEFDYGSENDATLSDPSDDDGFNVVLADNCQRVFVYGLKLLWTIKNRDAVWAWVGEIAKAFESPKPSPSRQYAQRKMIEEQQKLAGTGLPADDPSRLSTSPKHSKGSHVSSSSIHVDKPISSPSPSRKMGSSSSASSALLKGLTIDETGEEGTMNFMVNVVQPQFNLHSEEANGAFLLAAASGRVLARSFHSVLHVGFEMIQQALGAGGMHIPGSAPEMTWKRRELSVILEHVQAHVAPTDVDPGAGLQWLPKIPRTSPEVKRTGALLERVFMPCTMYFRYTRYKGGTTDLKIKPLKELYFNSSNITATMTSRQFHVMVDILSNLLLARLPKPRKSSLLHPDDEEEGIEEETDEVVPDGVEEVELARVKLEQAERECKLLLDDVRTIAVGFLSLTETDFSPEKEDTLLWMMSNGKSALVQNLKKELSNKRKARKAASALLRLALQRAAQQRLMDKEKNKSPSFAMRISWAIDKVVWSMLSDGKAFAEAEISHMILNVDRDYKDVGVAEFATRSFVVRNCLANAKSDVVLSAWNPPTEWGRNFMLRVDAKQGAPKDGNSPLELFQVDIYPLRIYLTETMYKMMWEYFFPEEEQDSQKRQEVWKVSTTAGSKRGKRGLSSNHEQASTSSHRAREGDTLTRSSAPGTPLVPLGNKQPFTHGDPSQLSFLMASHILEAPRLQSQKTTPATGPSAEHRRTSSFDRSWEENIAESVANELVCHAQGKKMYCSNSGPLSITNEHPSGIPTFATAVPMGSVDISKNRSREVKPIKAGRSSHEEKKPSKSHEEKKVSRARRALEFQNIKISQVELLVTYEGSRLAFNDLRLLMDTFTLVDYTGTWRRLFGRVRKHIIWGVLKSVTGMQGKKFKDKVQGQRQADGGASPDSDLNFSDSDGSQPGKNDQFPITWFKKTSDRAGESFVTSIRGLFNSQRRKAKAFVLRTMRGDAENEFQGEWSESDTEFSPFARQLTMTRARRLIRRHTKKFRSNRHKALPFLRDSFQSSPRTTPFQSEAESSSVSSAYEDFHD
ncbi:protein SABRE isoform X2 [Cryptomeria japonica]|nr:protein SABRE isoform X2 [Cryptomeria japonica]